MSEGFLRGLEAIDKPPFLFQHQQATDGYLNSALHGVWLCGPYLHNGSVPTLADLLLPPGQRPVTFLCGGSLLDPQKVGFQPESDLPIKPFLFDTRLRGNSNSGHDFGTGLAESDKQALLEFLKTL